MGYIILIQLFYSIILILYFHRFQQVKHLDFSISILIVAVTDGFSRLFLFCFYGKFATDSFEKMSNCLYECNWQGLPIDLQKFFIIIVANSQKPLYYNGFGLTTLDLETFSKVNACTKKKLINKNYNLIFGLSYMYLAS